MRVVFVIYGGMHKNIACNDFPFVFDGATSMLVMIYEFAVGNMQVSSFDNQQDILYTHSNYNKVIRQEEYVKRAMHDKRG